MQTRSVFMLLGVSGMLFAAATVPQMWVNYAIPGDAARANGLLIFDPPFTFRRDPATGYAHVGIDPSAFGLTVRVPSSNGSAPVVIGRRSVLDVIAGANITTALTDLGSSIGLQISAPGWCTFAPGSSTPDKPTSCVAGFGFGRGFLYGPENPGEPPQLLLDANYVVSRVPVPSGGVGSVCTGPSVFAGDRAFFWFCALTEAGDSYSWQRVAVTP